MAVERATGCELAEHAGGDRGFTWSNLSEEQTLRRAVIQSVPRDVLIAGIAANLRANERAKSGRSREFNRLAKRRAR